MLLRVLTAALLTALVLGGTAAAQGPPTTTAGPFQWAESGSWQRLPVFTHATPEDGWFEILPDVKLRQVPSKSTDPTYELIIAAPTSGHPTRDESLLLQLPGPTAGAAFGPRPPLMIAFHSFSRSEKEPFNGSDLPEECAARGWMLLAPLGLSQINFASPATMEALDATLSVIGQLAPFDRKRVFTAGFSMGGAGAMGYAIRKQDPAQLRVAGVVCHTGTMEVREAVEGYLANLEAAASGPFATPAQIAEFNLVKDEFVLLFGDLPANAPFAYDRVSVARFDDTLAIEPDSVPAWNLVDVPIYFHNDPADSSTQLVAQNASLFGFLDGLGFDVERVTNLSFCNGVQSHAWCSLIDSAALDFVASSVAPGPTPDFAGPFELHVEREVPYRLTDVRALVPNVYGRVTVGLPVLGSNSLALSSIRGVRTLAVDTSAAGLDVGGSLTLLASVDDAGADVRVVLRDYPFAPTQVLVGGLPAPRTDWSFDARTGELTLPGTQGADAVTYRVIP